MRIGRDRHPGEFMRAVTPANAGVHFLLLRQQDTGSRLRGDGMQMLRGARRLK